MRIFSLVFLVALFVIGSHSSGNGDEDIAAKLRVNASLSANPACLRARYTSAVDLLNCLSNFYYPKDSIPTQAAYDAMALPRSWFALVKDFLVHGCDATVPSDLVLRIYLKPIGSNQRTGAGDDEANADSKGICALYESQLDSKNKTFRGGWPILIVDLHALSSSNLQVHLQAPHILFDYGTDIEAATIFDLGDFPTLLISTRHRLASRIPSNCTKNHTITDPTHSQTEPFHQTAIALGTFANNQKFPSLSNDAEIFELENERFHGNSIQRSGGSNYNFLFVQLHRKGNTSCVESDLYVSPGLSSSYREVIQSHPNWPTNVALAKLIDVAEGYYPSVRISSPVNDSSCILVASTNLFGRFLNGVPSQMVCLSYANNSSLFYGNFMHIEQSFLATELVGNALSNL